MVKFKKTQTMQKPKSIGGVKPLIFLKEVRTELGKVIWPTRNQAVRLTAIVIGVSVLVAVFIGALDFIFTKLMAVILRR